MRSALMLRLLAAAWVLGAGDVRAELYKWYDEEGNLHVTQTPPPAHAQSWSLLDGKPVPTFETGPDESLSYAGEEPSRQIYLENVAVQIGSASERPKVVGSGCRNVPTVYDVERWARPIQWGSGFHGRLEELGYQTPLSADELRFAHEPKKAPDLSVIGVISDVAVQRCYVTRAQVDWRVFDNLRRRVVYETTTVGADRLRASKNPSHSLLEAFVSAANRLFEGARFRELATPSSSSPTAALDDDIEPVSLAFQYGTGGRSFADVAERLKAATGTIRRPNGHGSGFLLSSGGFFLTNHHVVDGLERVLVVLGRQELDARVIRTDAVRDVALLQVDGFVDASPLELARTRPRDGDPLYVIGTPLDEEYRQTVTRGVLSAVREVDGQRFYQTDASVHQGNSGGPAFNDQGDVIGIAVSGLLWKGQVSVGLNDLIPIQDALEALHIERQP